MPGPCFSAAKNSSPDSAAKPAAGSASSALALARAVLLHLGLPPVPGRR